MTQRGSAPAGPVQFDPFAPDVLADPYPHYRWLRAEAPVLHVEERGFWVVSRYGDCASALLDHAGWSSAGGNMIDEPPGRTGQAIGSTDRPRHRRLRTIFNRAFTRRRVAGLEPGIRRRVRELAGELEQRERADLLAEFTVPLVRGVVMGDVLGVPEDDHPRLHGWVEGMGERRPDRSDRTPEADGARGKALEYLGALVAERAGSRPDDVLGALIDTEVDGSRLTGQEVATAALAFIGSGSQATRWLIANAAVVLAEHPSQRREVSDDLRGVPNMIDESLRYDSVAQALARTSTRDVSLDGQVLRAGTRVCLLIGSANRDERQFADPDAFDVHRREAGQHLSFGHGIHLCLGAPLARLVGRVAFEELLARFPTYGIDVSHARPVRTPSFRGYENLPFSMTT